jgi:membrane-associated phospholipid phosphatase
LSPDYEVFCGAPDRNASFPSGHTSIAVTGAGLMCVHGEHRPLYGSDLGNRLVCYVGIAGAIATGVGRLINDRHYATDIVAGAAIGVLSGYVAPRWLHYGFSSEDPAEDGATGWAVTPMVASGALGASFTMTH